ncbi:MAG: ribosomal protein S18-alanine N-acetyltransferase [Pseudohongiellaceae bacterium]|jgi:ribosomal-protein-alanine N-acetyltransferase
MALPAGVLYRPLRVADFPALAAMLPALLPGDWSAGSLQGLLISTHHCRVLCSAEESGDALLGFAEYTLVADEGELLNLAIDSEVQGRGLGRALLRATLDELREKGARRCLLEVRRSNDPAIALYTREGFGLDGVRKAYYTPRRPQELPEDALLYSLRL